MNLNLIINSKDVELSVKPNQTLMDALRNNGYTEVKCGCSEGECGACMILLEDKPINSCQVLAMSTAGQNIKTINGVGTIHNPHPIQKAFVQAGADQCGFCSPGMIISAYSLLQQNQSPNHKEIVEALDGNLCRCTGYVKIVDAVKNAAAEIQKLNS